MLTSLHCVSFERIQNQSENEQKKERERKREWLNKPVYLMKIN